MNERMNKWKKEKKNVLIFIIVQTSKWSKEWINKQMNEWMKQYLMSVA